MDTDLAREYLANAQAELGHEPDGRRFQKPPNSATKPTIIAWADDLREHSGLAYEWIRQAQGLLAPDAPLEEPQEPPAEPGGWPPQFDLYAGFMGRTHWDGDARATDVYLPVEIGTWLGWPVAVEVQRFPTSGPQGTIINALARCVEGPWAGWSFLIGHVLDSVQTGRRAAWEPFYQYGNSGIAQLPGHAEHSHIAVDRPGGPSWTQDGKGDVSAADALLALGLPLTLVDRIPGPADYQAGRAVRGRFI